MRDEDLFCEIQWYKKKTCDSAEGAGRWGLRPRFRLVMSVVMFMLTLLSL